MDFNLNTLISLGILGIVSFALRGMFALREDVREIKSVLGINGHPDQGLVPEIARLRLSRHDHANRISELLGDVQELKARVNP